RGQARRGPQPVASASAPAHEGHDRPRRTGESARGAPMKHAYANHYAEGRFLPSRGEVRMPVVDPSTGVEAGHVVSCSTEDVERAVGSARSGFQAWSRSTLDERREALGRLHAQLSARTDEATRLLAQEIGCPVWLGGLMQLPMPLKGL